MKPILIRGYEAARKIVVAVIGGTVVAIGIAMLVLPGPAFVVIPVGIAVLALEFAWARRWLKMVRDRIAPAKPQAAPDRPATR
jgi:tellurite resistance protein TerC